MTDKLNRLLGPVSIEGCRGLEIGPLASPMVAKSKGSVLYVDYATTEVVRANQHDPAVNVANVVDVDIVWGERSLKQAVGREVDYVVASHVIEHVPDLIGWLGEVHDVLAPGGTLGLAVPDRRFTFDLWRRESTLAEMVEAYLLHYRSPSIRQVFDAASLAVSVDPSDAWRSDPRRGGPPGEIAARLPEAFALARRLVTTPRYLDAHCWVFTPATFLDTADALLHLDLFPFLVDAFFPTEPGDIEFQVRLIAATEKQHRAIAESIAAARRTLATAVEWPRECPSTAIASVPAPGGPDLMRIQGENADLRFAIECIRGSTSWRITAPLRTVARKLRQLRGQFARPPN